MGIDPRLCVLRAAGRRPKREMRRLFPDDSALLPRLAARTRAEWVFLLMP